MSKECFCPHCGKRIAVDAEQRFCMFCGEPLNEAAPQTDLIMTDGAGNNCSVSYAANRNHTITMSAAYDAEPTNKPKWWQTISAAILFCMTAIIPICKTFYPKALIYIPDTEFIGLYRFFPLVSAIGIAILLKGAKNRATQIAFVIWIACDILDVIFNFLPSIPDESSLVWLDDVLRIIHLIIIPVCTFYGYSLIARNNAFRASSRTWLHILLVGYVQQLFWNTIFYWMPHDLLFDNGSRDLPLTYIFVFNGYILFILCACGWWVFSRSEAFGGPYDKEALCNYSPLNKYMAMFIIAPAILISLMLLIFNYAEELTKL